MENLNKTLARLPIVPFILAYMMFLGYQYWDWMNSTESELGVRRAQIGTLQKDLETTKKKLASGEEFYKNLDAIRARIRQLTLQLEGTKTSLSADIDIANFVRMITLEAKKLGITIKSITPNKEQKKEYYTEVPFNVSFRGAYVQILVLFDRIARFQQVIRIGDFAMTPTGNTFTKYVELQGNVTIQAYKYLGNHVDDIINKAEMKGNERGEGQ